MQHRGGKQTARVSEEDAFGEILRQIRKDRGLSQEELAFQTEYHPSYISQLERGRKSPSLRTIMRLAGVLDTPASEILRRVEGLLSRVRKPRTG
jgi:transcriptional regulator with XRE-family HTH domain